MKLPDLYGNWRVVAGAVLMLLGMGNWLVGLGGINEYSHKLAVLNGSPAADVYRNFDELDAHTDGAVLAPLIQQQRTVSYAAAQMDFYHAVYLTGRILFAIGLLMTLLACIAAIRQDTRRALAHKLAWNHDQPPGIAHPSQD